MSGRTRLTRASRRDGGRRLAAVLAVLGVFAVFAVAADLLLPTAAVAAGGPQFLERAPLVIPLDSLRGDAGKAGWAVQVVNPLPRQSVDAELRVAGPVAAWLSVRSPATVRIAPGAVATFRVVRSGSARAGSGELVLIAGGALDRRAIIIASPPQGLLARWRARLFAVLVVVLLSALAIWLLARRGRPGRSRLRRHRSNADLPTVPAGPAPPRLARNGLARNDGSGTPGPPPAPGLLYNDEPTTRDDLDREQYAAELARLARDAQPPLVIGVFGEWGSGKTSLLQQVRDQLKADRTSAIAWFDAWKYQYDENPVLPLLHAVIRDLRLETRQDIRRTLQVISEALGSIVLSTTSRMTVTDLRSSIHAYDEAHFQLRSERTRLDGHFSDLVTSALQVRGGSRLVVFIDDLDRCLPDQILALLEALKLYLNRTDCVFFLAVDSQRLVQAVTGKYKDIGIDGADYLEKIVQMPFQMPRLSPSGFKKYLNTLLPDDLKAAAEVLSIGLRPNPRAVKRFVNILRLQDLLARNRGVDPYDVTVLAAVLLARSMMPEFYARLEGDPTLLLRVAEDLRTAEEGAAPNWDEQVIRLVGVLSNSTQGVPNDVTAYIDLAAAARPPDGATEQGRVFTAAMVRSRLRQQEPGARLMLRGAKFAPGEDLSRMQLRMADLSGAQLAEVRLQETDLSGAQLVDADLRRADLTGAILTGADLTGANLTGAILTGVDLRRAELDRAAFAYTDLSEAFFEDTSAQTGAGSPPSTRETPAVTKDRLQQARMMLIERLTERLSQLPSPEELVDLTLVVRDDLSELTDPYRASVDVVREPITLRSSQLLGFFQQADQELLMVGNPGSGKTTLALRLVGELRSQAEHDPNAPVPVLLRIVSWPGSGARLSDWLSAELAERYRMPLMLADLLINEGALVYVLDGLDELSPQLQHRFMDTARAFIALSRKEHGSARMIVTTRPVGSLDLATRLRLRGAVELQPLIRAQASTYLEQHALSEEARDRARQFIASNPEFDVSSPLLLQMLVRTFEVGGTMPSSSLELIDQFAHDQLGKLGQEGQFDAQMAETWLIAIAKRLSLTERSTFSSEDPDIRSALRKEGLVGREVPAFLRAVADLGLLTEVRENEYSFLHRILQEYFSGLPRGR